MDAINAALAIIALMGGFLCARAFLPHINITGNRPVDLLARGLLACGLATFPRIAFWDVAWAILGIQSPLGIATNLTFNAVLLVGVYWILRARWLTIPENERPFYNIFTAAFYPSNLFPRLRREDEE